MNWNETIQKLYKEAPPRSDILESQVFLHLKTGGLYVVEDWDCRIEATWTQGVLYRSLATGQRVVRPLDEFADGRFQRLSHADLARVKAKFKEGRST